MVPVQIVCLDDCSGERTMKMLVDEEADDIMRAIADRYLEIHCSVMTRNDGRLENTKAMIERFKVDGVVDSTTDSGQIETRIAAFIEML